MATCSLTRRRQISIGHYEKQRCK